LLTADVSTNIPPPKSASEAKMWMMGWARWEKALWALGSITIWGGNSQSPFSFIIWPQIISSNFWPIASQISICPTNLVIFLEHQNQQQK
jgi:hypothetical protein